MHSNLDIYSEEDAQNKVILPLLINLGYEIKNMEFQKPIKVTIGGSIKTIYPDIVVNIDNHAALIVEMKKPGVKIDEIATEQAISYARLMPTPVPFAVISNGYDVRIYDVITKQRIPEIPSKEKYLQLFSTRVMNRTISEEQKEEARKFLMGFSDVKAFAKVLSECHDYIRAHEGLDPTAAFDEISKILFIKMHEEIDAEENNRKSKFTVKKFSEEGFDYINSVLFKETKRKFSGLFDENERINLRIKTIEHIAHLLESYSLKKTDIDIKGVAFETFLSKTFRGEGLGQYFTPREIVNFMVELTNPRINSKILDPACGSGGFLKACYRKIKEDINSSNFTIEEKKRLIKSLAENQLFGMDINPRLAQTCKMNMIVHGDGNTGIFRHNGLLDIKGIIDKELPDEEKFDIILTNPPFGSTIKDPNIIKQFQKFGINNGKVRKSTKSEILFLERCLDLIKPGGEIAIIVPDGILSNTTYKYVRDGIKEKAIIKAIISLPSDAFISRGATVKTSILYLRKKVRPEEKQKDIFMAVAEKVGYDTTGKEIMQNDLPSILMQYKNYIKGNDINFNNAPLCFYTKWSDVEERLDVKYYLPKYLENVRILANKHGRNLIELKKICKLIKRGKQPNYSESGSIPVIKTANIQDGEIKWDGCLKVDPKFFNNSIKIYKNDVLLASTGVGSIGKVAYVEDEIKSTVDSHITIIRLKENTLVEPYYLYSFLKSRFGQLQIEQRIRGATGQIEIYPDDVKSIKIPCLDKKSQIEIINIKKNALKESKELLKNVKVQYSQIEKLLYNELGINSLSDSKKCFVVKKENIIKHSRLDVEFYDFLYNKNFIGMLSKAKYPVIKLSKIIKQYTKLIDPNQNDDKNYEVLSVYNDGTVRYNKTLKGSQFNQKYKLVLKNQIVYNPYRINVGSIGIVPDELEGKIISPAYIVFETSEEINPYFLVEILRTDFYRNYINIIGTGSVRNSIPFNKLKNILIPLPDRKIQDKIIKEIENIKECVKNSYEKANAILNEANDKIEEIILK